MNDFRTHLLAGLLERLHRNNRDRAALLESWATRVASTTPSLSAELRYCARTWNAKNEKTVKLLENTEEFGRGDVLAIIELLPPDRIFYRYDVERLTVMYREIRHVADDAVVELFGIAENALIREDYDIGINLLQQVIRKDPRYTPGLIAYGCALLAAGRNPEEAVENFERALSFTRHEHAEHYRSLILEFLARAYEAAGKYSLAVKTLKRMRTLDTDMPGLDYQVARNFITGRQHTEGLATLDSIIENHPEFLGMAIIDTGFEKVRDKLVERYLELVREWEEDTLQLVEKLDQMVKITRIYAVDERDEEVKQAVERIQAARRELEEQGCYSIYHAFYRETLPQIVPGFPDRLNRQLEIMAAERREMIDEINRSRKKLFQQSNIHSQRLAFAVWIGSILAILVILILLGVDSLLALMAAVFLIPVGYWAYAMFQNFRESGFEQERIGSESVRQVRNHQREISWIKSSIRGKVSREGWV